MQAGYQVQQGAFAATRGADDGGDHAGLRGERNFFQHSAFGSGVAESGAGELDGGVWVRDPDRVGRGGDGSRRIEHLGDPFGAGGGAWNHDRQHGEHHHRHEDLQEIGQEGHQRPHLHLSLVNA
ncbi:Uncharacterised protein [Mycobacteroides abscessus]|nr:Uncharacterised protein [Mycobacteroides abscessus]